MGADRWQADLASGKGKRPVGTVEEDEMAEVLVFHHAHGRTPGVLAFADELRQAGHTVHVPDLYQGQLFDDLEAGVAHAEQVGFGELARRGARAADGLPEALVLIGFSLGVLPAQSLVVNRPGAVGAVLVGSCVPPADLGGVWPPGVPVQVHGMADDLWFVGEGDVDAARALVAEVDRGELFLYPGDGHLFADRSLPSYDAAAAELLTARVLSFLADLG